MDGVGSSGSDGEGQDICVETAGAERVCDLVGAALLGPDDDGGARARQRHAGGPGWKIVTERGEQRRVLVAERLVQAVVEGCGQEHRVAGGDRGTEERGTRS